jgi:hypothetical protein
MSDWRKNLESFLSQSIAPGAEVMRDVVRTAVCTVEAVFQVDTRLDRLERAVFHGEMPPSEGGPDAT